MVETFHEYAEKSPVIGVTPVSATPIPAAKKHKSTAFKVLGYVLGVFLIVQFFTTGSFANVLQATRELASSRSSSAKCPHAETMAQSIDTYFQKLQPIPEEQAKAKCPVYPTIAPSNDSYSYFRTDEFREYALKNLQGIVQIPSESYDDLGEVGTDPRWDIFYKVEEFFKKSFPETHKQLTLDKVNTHGLIYTWKGSDESLKPVLLAAHQDVVPVLPETRGLWDHDPYSAYFDGEHVWGRGASDDKNPLVGILEAIEILLTKEPEFVPKRTIVVGFGFDEEVSGYQGAQKIGQFLEEKYGKHSFEAIVDEGAGIAELEGVKVAMPAISEKGFYNAEVVLHTPGGHSSIPPDQTAIGIIGRLAALIEDTPFHPKLTVENPFYKLLTCLAVYSPTFDDKFKKAILHAGDDAIANKYLTKVISSQRELRYNIQTSQAIDIVKGGLKVNALPEEVHLITNFRVSTESNISDTRSKIVGNVLTIAHRFGLGVTVNITTPSGDTIVDEIIPATAAGYFTVSDYGKYIEPSPVSPAEGSTWETLAGTIRHVFENYAGTIGKASVEGGNDNVLVAPSLMPANTDTRHYWGLTENIYRFSPYRATEVNPSMHTVNENILLDIHLETVVFYYAYIKNLSK